MVDDIDLSGIDFKNIDVDEIRAELGITPDDTPIEAPPVVAPPRRKRRGPGRPSNAEKKAEAEWAAKVVAAETAEVPPSLIPPAPLSKRDEREIADRLANMLMGGTGIAGVAKPYLAMTEQEARSISEPLASYLVRTADTSPYARQILEHYDLMAIVFGVMAYVVRVYNDRRNEVAVERAAHQSTTITRIRASEVANNGTGPNESDGGPLGFPYGSGSVGTIPT